MQADGERTWTTPQRRLHWWTAAFVLLAFSIGWPMVGLPLRHLFLKFILFQLHKTAGLSVLALAVARLVIRWRRGRPDWDADLPPWQRQAAWLTHVLLYLLLIAIPVLGYLTAATAPARVPTLFLGVIPVPHVLGPDEGWFAVLRPMHRALAVLLALLACGHAIAAMHNHLAGRAMLARMWRGDPRLDGRKPISASEPDTAQEHLAPE